MKQMQGNSMGKLCFSMFFFRGEKKRFYWLFAFLYTCTRHVFVQRGHTLDLPHQTLPVEQKRNERQASGATKWLLGWRKEKNP